MKELRCELSPVKLPSSVRYWTVVDEGYRVVRVADEYLQHLRLGQDAAESTTKAYAEALALYLRWCEQGSRDWRTAAETSRRVHHVAEAHAWRPGRACGRAGD